MRLLARDAERSQATLTRRPCRAALRQAGCRAADGLYRQQRREHPDLSQRALYEGPQANGAAELVRRAEESFTDWPVERELRFRHVVHYLIFEEYMRVAKAREGTKINMGIVVARVVPEEI
jgi:hypothetical protein